MLSPQLRRDIRELWDAFWAGGISNPLTAIEQITYLIFLKRLEDVGIAKENYRWSYLKTLEEEELLHYVRGPVFDWMKTLDQSGERMRDAVFVIPNPSLLKRAIEKIDKLFIEERNKDTLGDIYEMLLSEIAEAGKNGQFRTPRHIIRAMCDLVDVKLGDKVCDPACGTSGFLVNAFQHILMQETDPDQLRFLADGTPVNATGNKLKQQPDWSQFFYGFDIDRTMVRLGWMNMILHGLENPNIEYANTLGKRWNHNVAEGGKWQGAFDVVLANPPFAAKLDKKDIGATLEEAGTNKSELLFLELTLQLLSPTGRAAIIVPEGVLFGSTKAHRNLREKLVNENNLKAIISLPQGVFNPYAGVKTSIVVFERGSLTEQVWFYEVVNDGYTLSARRDEDFDHNDLWDMQVQYRLHHDMTPNAFVNATTPDLWQELQDTEEHVYVQSVFVDRAEDVNSNEAQEKTEPIRVLELEELTKIYPAEESHWQATINEIKSNSYNATAARYKPFSPKTIRYDPPDQIVKEIIDLEDKIQKSLGKLLTKIKADQ